MWPRLEEDRFCELRHGVASDSHALRVATDLADRELAGSALVRIGPILWALSGVAGEWHGADTLILSCTASETPAPHGFRAWPAPLFAARVLVPLCRFGVME